MSSVSVKRRLRRLAGRLRDNIPPPVTTSIDGPLHRAGDLGLMVDGMFTTQGYEAREVRVVDGVSDHCALVATVARR